jgi:hypothetical protein
MHHHGTRAHTPDDSTQLQQALLGLLVHDHTGLWSLAELDRALHSSSDTPPGQEPNTAAVEDAVEDLYAAGLLHRIGHYVCATRAAHTTEHINA